MTTLDEVKIIYITTTSKWSFRYFISKALIFVSIGCFNPYFQPYVNKIGCWYYLIERIEITDKSYNFVFVSLFANIDNIIQGYDEFEKWKTARYFIDYVRIKTNIVYHEIIAWLLVLLYWSCHSSMFVVLSCSFNTRHISLCYHF